MTFSFKYQAFIKPLVDWLSALILLVALSPVFVAIYLSLIACGLSPLYHHARPGKNARIFKMIKFTTMRNSDPNSRFKLGKLLRKSSLDELPQLINVLRGEMSIVGPRPLLVEYLRDYDEEEKKRHNVKPGITGLAQINGRNKLTLREKIAYDLEYVYNISFSLDLKILLKTLVKVFKWKESDYHSLHVKTLDEFEGR